MEGKWTVRWVLVLIVASFLLMTEHLFSDDSNEDGYATSSLIKALPLLNTTKAFQRISSKPCTFALFREAYRDQGNFPGGGEWHETDGVVHYQPAICKFRYPRVSSTFMSKCLSKANLTYLITMGDSTGGKYYDALRRTSTIKFNTTFAESLNDDVFMPDKDYFTRDMSKEVAELVKIKFRFCGGCRSRTHRGNVDYENVTHSLTVEHIVQTMILDDTLEIVHPSYQASKHVLENIWAITTQELILRYYLNDKPPDVVIVFLPLIHAMKNIRLSRLPIEIEYFKGLLEEYLPRSTKLIFITSHGTFEEARKGVVKVKHYVEGMPAREKIDKMNHILYEVLEDDLLQTDGRYFGFLDLIEMSNGCGKWIHDNAHMEPVWYDVIMSMFWETYCNSVLQDSF